jgi:hypothetical protein
LSRARSLLASTGLLGALLLAARAVLAQDPFGPGLAPGFGPTTPPQPGKPPPTKGAEPEPGQPELHAAGDGDSLVPPGNEPSLPEHPRRIRASVADRIGPNTFPDDEETGRSSITRRSLYGPYYEEQSGQYRFRTVFPLWVERNKLSLTDPTRVDRASVYGGLFYNRRSAERADDVLFPLAWNLRDLGGDSRTTIVGPFVNRVAPGERDNWLVPLYLTGKRRRGGYTLIPPLLTYTTNDGDSGLTVVGPGFCVWEGGAYCDARTAQDIDFGIAPLYFYGQNEQSKYELIVPLLHYYGYDDRDLSWVNVWGPLYREHTQKRDLLHVLPLYFSIRGEQERHTTVLPFFHYGYDESSWLFVNPLFLLARGDEGEKTFVTWGYARYRGRTQLDMITPLYWHYRDPDTRLDQHLVFPFLYSRTSPRESDQVFFPFWGHFERFGVNETTWITPFFQHTHDLRGWSTNIHPILYLGRDGYATHTVLAPFFWDFAGRRERATVGFPIYWRFSDRETVSQLVGNVYYRERKVRGGLDWELHFFPVFTYGETPDGHWWNVLYGLAGYTRQGRLAKMRTLWIPFTVSGED